MSTPTNDQLNDFERDLLADLRTYVAERSQPETASVTEISSKRRPRRTRIGLVVAAATAATIGSVSLLGGGSAAYAVDAGDEAITVRIIDRTDAAGLEAALAEHGIDADVDYSGDSAVAMLEGPDGMPELQPYDDTPPTGDDPLLKGETVDKTVTMVSSGDKACPNTADGTKPPITIKRDGDEYVVKLTGAAIQGAANLQLSIFVGGHTEGVAGIYSDGGLSCGASTTWAAS